MKRTVFSALAVGAGLAFTSVATGAVILFDDAPRNGASYWADSGSSSGPTSGSDPVYSGTTAVKISQGDWSQGGLQGIGAAPSDSPILRLRYYRQGAGKFVLRLSSSGSPAVWLEDSGANNNSAHWKIDGVNGYAANSANQWHTLEIDVPAMNLGANVARIGTGSSSGTDLWYFDDVAWVAVPEPAALSLVGVAGVAMLSRRRRC